MCFARALIFCCFITFGVEILRRNRDGKRQRTAWDFREFPNCPVNPSISSDNQSDIKKTNNAELFPDPDERYRRITVTVLTLVNHVLFSYLQQLIFSMLRRRVTAFACLLSKLWWFKRKYTSMIMLRVYHLALILLKFYSFKVFEFCVLQ